MAIHVLYRQERTGSLAEHCTLPTPSATAATPPSSLLVSALRSSCPAGWTGPWSRITAMAAPAAAAPLRAVAPWRDVLKRALGANRGVRHSRYVQLATVRPDGRPANRSVVYRGFLGEDSDVLTFVTDSRCLGSAGQATVPPRGLCSSGDIETWALQSETRPPGMHACPVYPPRYFRVEVRVGAVPGTSPQGAPAAALTGTLHALLLPQKSKD